METDPANLSADVCRADDVHVEAATYRPRPAILPVFRRTTRLSPGRRSMSQSAKLSVLNPEVPRLQTVDDASGAAARASLAKRLDSLDGKTVYLVDTGFGGSFKFMRELENWFACNMPSVTTVRKRKPGGPFADDVDTLWEEIKERGDAAILGVGG
jgi:hypothetical protein